MRILATGLLVLVLAIPATANAGPNHEPWFVRAALVADDLPCDSAYVRLYLTSRDSEPLLVPLKSSGPNDAEWLVESLEPGIYELAAQVVSCAGVPGPLVTLEFEYSKDTLRKEVYLGLRSRRQVITLDYLEAATLWDGSAFVSIESDGKNVLVTNVSDVPLHRCQYESAYIDLEFLVDGTWGTFNEGGAQGDWPEDLAVLEPAGAVRMMPGVRVVTKPAKEPRSVRPSAKRYTLTVQPMRRSFVTLTEPEWAPAGLPTCDRYRVEQPVTESDPSLKIWD